MIDVSNKALCTGCASCANACPLHIIKLVEDEEGFDYPRVDITKCVNCHICEKVCPLIDEKWNDLKNKEGRYPVFFAGQLKNKALLNEVSSGGAFWALAQEVISRGGVVYGAAQINVDLIKHVRTTSIEDARSLRRSKYLQSSIGNTYAQVKKDLKEGIPVLFSGTGCQIGGLVSYLGERFDNLYTCDVVCHGVPSKRVWRRYREEKEKKEGKIMVDLVFRDKSLGWSNNQYRITYDDGAVEKEDSSYQLFHAGYLNGLFYRPSCGECKFSTLPRISDITLADYWMYSGEMHGIDNDLGVSLISVNSERGGELLSASSVYINVEKTNDKIALESCHHLYEHPIDSAYRDDFFKVFSKYGYFKAAELFVDSHANPSFLYRAVRRLKRFIVRSFCI